MSSPATALHDAAAYRALQTHDARFDGRLFVGVTSTGIYCRPVCRVKAPRRENCRFFASAALAESKGFRPCLRCRPELAPGLSLADSSDVLADQAARWLDQAAHDGLDPPLPDLAARLGVTDRHLRRIFSKRHGVTPLAWLTTQRLLLAKQLLTDTALPVTQVALAAGFGSLRRFNAAFAERYRLSPTALRREGAAEPGALKLAWRPPFDLDGLLGFIARRAVPGQEVVDGLAVRRTLAVEHQGRTLAGWLEAKFVPDRCELRLSVSPSLRPALGPLLQRARHAFDLDADPARIDPVLLSVPGPAREGIRLPGSWDGFETAVRVVLGQQVTVAAARTLTQRLVQRFGTAIETPFAGLDRLFPAAETLASADPAAIGTLGIVRQRVKALQALAAAVSEGRLQLRPGADLDATLAALTALPGIGDWSAQLIALRTLAWPDAWPASDIGLLKALDTRDVAAAAAQAEAWRPWRGYAVFKLWHSLENSP
ncbi:MAG: DNA-3-methyladenine glycosylase 2 family protein [Burkholderiaceae bacterium]|nr:DNA-3-methyladenine glycosylase 2 family protein [Burkholderiaceae bacterium]